ncbi:MAG: SDR family oxidoreductase [Nitrospina sp.]|nr:SDR family oxidoreductase [Nitrospina sp.]
MDRYEEIQVGDYAEICHVITASDIEKFVDLTGDDNSLHVDAEYASKTVFKKPVVHGMLGASFISTLIGTKLPGDGALWFSQSLEFLLPVRVGDEITITAKVVKKIDRERVIELQTDIFNGNRQKVTSGVAKVKVVALLPVEVEADVQSRAIIEKKTAIIIGATGGIGAATARKFAENSYDLILHYNSNSVKARNLKDEFKKLGVKVVTVQGDIRERETVEKLYESTKRISPYVNAIVHAATIGLIAVGWEDLEWEMIQNQIDINIKSSFLLAKRFLPMMEQSGRSGFVFVSTQSVEAPVPNWLHYTTAKSALVGMAKSMAIDFAKMGVRVNLVSPGMTETDLISDVPQKARLLIEVKSPRHRLAQPVDIANAIYFLASEEADYLTGETIRVNGGMVMI